MPRPDASRPVTVVMAEFSDARFDARVKRCAQALADAGYDVHLHMFNASRDRDSVLRRGGITTHERAFLRKDATPPTGLGRALRLAQALRIMSVTWATLLVHKADVYHAHNLYYLLPAVLAAKVHRGRVVYDAHEIHSEAEEPSTNGARARNALRRVYERKLAAACDATIQASEERAMYVAHAYRIPLPSVVNNYVPRVEQLDGKDRLRELCGLSTSVPILLYAGGVYSGQSRRLDAVFAALPYMPEVHMAILGFMNDRVRADLLRTMRQCGVETRVHLLGACRPEELVHYAASADVGLIPLAGDVAGIRMPALNKISEYLMAGLPIACTGMPALERIVYSNPVGQVGECFDLESPASIARAVGTILLNVDGIRYRENARRLAIEHLSWEGEVPVLLDLYSRILSDWPGVRSAPLGNGDVSHLQHDAVE